MTFLVFPSLAFYHQALADLQTVATCIPKALFVEMEYEVLRSASEKPHQTRKWRDLLQEQRCCLVQNVPNVRPGCQKKKKIASCMREEKGPATPPQTASLHYLLLPLVPLEG